MSQSPSMPYRIETERLVLRCYQPADAPLLKQAVDESLTHLRAWMDWSIHEPTPLNAKIELLRRMRGDYDLDRDYNIGIFSADEQQQLGGTGLHTRLETGAFEIGYWIHVDHCGRGYAREAAAALTEVGLMYMQATRIEIRCDPANLASQTVPRRLGYSHTTTLPKQSKTPMGEPRDTMVWTMSAASYLAAAQRPQGLKLFDSTGAAIKP